MNRFFYLNKYQYETFTTIINVYIFIGTHNVAVSVCTVLLYYSVCDMFEF